MTKHCTKCGQEKPESEFHRWHDGKKHPRCKQCRLADGRLSYQQANADQQKHRKEYRRKYNSLNRVHIQIMHHARYLKNKKAIQHDSRRKLYGITAEQFHAMLSKQKGQCASCYVPFDNNKRDLRCCVDHHHESGRIRALLCGRCNLIIGLARENMHVLLRAAAYLMETNVDYLRCIESVARDAAPKMVDRSSS